MNPYLDLFLTFAQMGVCTFGGGYAMLPILQREVVEKRGWATEDELMDYYAIGQCTPGVIAVNTSTFIGYRLRGVPGAITATAGMVFPSLVIITIIAAFIQQFAHLAVVQHAFAGIRACVCALILCSVIRLGKQTVIDRLTAVIAAAVCVLMLCSKVISARVPALSFLLSPVAFVLIAGGIGLLVTFFGKGKGGEKT